ncbi:phospholipase A [bacterium]|nr:phospholipase A [bacterium]
MGLFHLLLLSCVLAASVFADSSAIQPKTECQESDIISGHAEAHQKFYESLDSVDNPETEKTIRQFSESQFNLGTYETNYFLPFSHRNNGDYQNRTESKYDPKSIETEFQFSVRVDYVTMLFGHDVTYSFGYTQKSFWQTYVPRAYFRENNYNPELFMTIPTYHALDRLHIKQFGLYLGHQSNGRGELQSDANLTGAKIERSWNYLAGSILFQTGALFTEIKGWYRIPDNRDYNPDLMAYIGYGYVEFKYPYGKHLFSLKLRHGLNRHYGSIDAAYSYPLSSRDDLFYYVKYFSGYEESLIDYDQYVNKIGIGFAFSR